MSVTASDLSRCPQRLANDGLSSSEGAMEGLMVKEESFDLVLSERDFEASDRKKIEALSKKSRILHGEEKPITEELMDALPKAIAKRIQGLVPKNFAVSEFQFKLHVSGTVFGAGISGDVIVKLAPRRDV